MPSMIDSPPQKLPDTGDWISLLCAAKEGVKTPSHAFVLPSATKKPAPYGARKKNLEMCTEALGCETGGVDAFSADVVVDYGVENEGAERKRRARKEEAEPMTMQGRVRRALPPPLTTLARGAGRVRMVHERRDGRLEVYPVRAAGVEADRSGGRLRLRFLPCASCSNATECHGKKSEQQAEEDTKGQETEEEEEHGVAMYVRDRRCVEAGVAATTAAARRGKKQWEPEQATAFWVATS